MGCDEVHDLMYVWLMFASHRYSIMVDVTQCCILPYLLSFR